MRVNVAVGSDSFLLTQFRDFYREVLRLRKLIESGSMRFHMHSDSNEITTTVSMVQKIWQDLAIKIEQQNAVAQRGGSGNFSASTYHEAIYIMAAVADETFVYLNWDGRDLWREKLLESYHFGTHIAGDEIFNKIDSLLEMHEQSSLDLATIYLSALSLGFQGKYRGDEGTAKIKEYREKLFRYIFRRDPECYGTELVMFPEAYEQTIARGMGKRLSNPRQWWIVASVSVAIFLVISYWLWRNIAEQIEPIVRDILQRV